MSLVHRHVIPCLLLLCVGLAISFTTARAQWTRVRICSYNLGSYGASEPPARIDALRQVIMAVHPDLLIVQGLNGAAGVSAFTQDVMSIEPSYYRLTIPEYANLCTVCGSFYLNVNSLPVGGSETWLPLSTPGRVLDASGIWLNDPVFDPPGRGLNFLTIDLPEGGDSATSAARVADATVYRDRGYTMPSYHFLALGAVINSATTEELAYALLADTVRTDSPFRDPAGISGTWRGNAELARHHTYSTRSAAEDPSSAGLVDRPDILFVTPSLMNTIRPGSYTVFGNDGRHFGRAVDDGVNEAVPAEIARALRIASAHLPVYAEFDLSRPAAVASPVADDEGLTIAPQPARDRLTFTGGLLRASGARLRLYSAIGGLALEAMSDDASSAISVPTDGLMPGLYAYEIVAGARRVRGSVIVAR